jgi:GntR family transcriptional regulator
MSSSKSAATEDPGRTPRRPLYLEAAERLREMIGDGTFGDVLPSQDQLCEVLGVSRPTVRETIRILEQGGFLTTRQGAATTINRVPRLEANFGEFFSASELISRGGCEPGTDLIDLRRTMATSGRFPVFAGQQVFTVERVRTADDTPFVLAVDVIPDLGYEEDELRAGVAEGSMMTWLENHGLVVHHAKTNVSAAVAEGHLSERLQVPAGTPLLFMEEVAYDSADRPIWCGDGFYRCDLIQFNILRRRGFS